MCFCSFTCQFIEQAGAELKIYLRVVHILPQKFQSLIDIENNINHPKIYNLNHLLFKTPSLIASIEDGLYVTTSYNSFYGTGSIVKYYRSSYNGCNNIFALIIAL